MTPCLQIAISRAEYYAYLKRIVDAGYGDRVMFGSDVGLPDFGTGIDAIVDARVSSSSPSQETTML